MRSQNKALLSMLIAMLFSLGLSAQTNIVITEIMYNPPESGMDTLEFIEIYNKGSVDVDLTGYTFTQGVTGDFPSITLAADAYLVMAVDSVAIFNNFGVTAYQWTSGGLSNGGEDIIIVDGSGNAVDTVDYDDGGGWPTDPDGNGSSLVFCDASLYNNSPNYWAACTTPTGIMVNGKELKAHPGSGCPAISDNTPPTVSWVGAINDTIIKVQFNEWIDTASAETAANYSLKSGITIQSVSLIHADSVEIELNASLTANLKDTLVVSSVADTAGNAMVVSSENEFYFGVPTPPSIPTYTLTQISTEDANGVADSIGVECRVIGIVMGVNMGSGIDMTINDGSAGIGVYKSSNFTPAFTVTEGDQVRVMGTIGQYNGKTQMYPDSIVIISSGNTLPAPSVVTALDETTESQLVRINGLSLVDPSQWPATGENKNVSVTDGTNTYTMRIDKDTDIDGSTAPTGTFDAIGIGGQFDSSDPYTSGYQFYPRSQADIIAASPAFAITNAFAVNDTLIKIAFNDDVDTTTAETLANYTMKSGISIEAASVIDVDSVLVELATALTHGTADTITVNLVKNDAETETILNSKHEVMFGSAPQPGIPAYTIAEVTTENADGVADSLNTECQLTGVVMGVNMRSSGLEFYMHDGTAGIAVFKSSNFSTNPYTVNEGDEIRIYGSIGQYNGLTQMKPDSITLISTGNALMTPIVVNTLGESNEANLVRINNLTLTDPSQWPTTAGSAVNVSTSNGTETFMLRIDENSGLQGTAAPTSTFSIIGILGQFDFSSPYTSGYQVFPRHASDVILTSTFAVSGVAVPTSTSIKVAFNEDVDTASAETSSNYTLKSGIVVSSASIIAVDSVELTLASALTSGVADTLTVHMVANDAETDTIKNASFQVVSGSLPTPTIPSYSIADVTGINANGELDSVGVECKLTGVVHGINFKGNGLQFVIHDGTDGIWTYRSTNLTPAYTVNEGDEVRIIGSLAQYMGLAQIYIDSLVVVNTAQNLQTVAVVTSLDESTEAELVKLKNLSLVDPSSWPTTAGSSKNIEVTNGTTTFSVRLVADCNLQGTPAPTGTFDLTGLVGQFHSTAPYTDGYQIFPRYTADLVNTTGLDEEWAQNISVYPNPTTDVIYIQNPNAVQLEITVMNLQGQVVHAIHTQDNLTNLQLNELSKGIYMIRMTNVETQSSHVQKVILK